jgi:hypothetical protein
MPAKLLPGADRKPPVSSTACGERDVTAHAFGVPSSTYICASSSIDTVRLRFE